MSLSTLTPLKLAEVETYLRHQAPANAVLATCLHNTEEPDLSQWQGLASMQSIRRYHMETKGWSDIAANFYVDASRVWTARPLDATNWCHAYVQASRQYADWSAVHPNARRLCGDDRSWLNHHAIGVEVVGRFDRDDPATSPSMALAIDLFALMHRVYNLPLDNLLFHRMVEYKTCPGTRVSLDWFRGEVAKPLGQPAPTPLAVIAPNGQPLACNAALVGDETWVDLGALLPALAGKALELRRHTAEGPSRCKLREVAESFGFKLATNEWPTVRITKL